MKVISNGYKTTKCGRCGCIMEYDSNDIQSKIVTVSTSALFRFLKDVQKIEYIVCPQCGKEITIEREWLT